MSLCLAARDVESSFSLFPPMIIHKEKKFRKLRSEFEILHQCARTRRKKVQTITKFMEKENSIESMVFFCRVFFF